ncbi:hypothetical protein HELRODRAFT_160514 [Helobdella robusta]|uniref:SAFB-like transcription modulator n=1 Tax=Helobdella robusta TaxID=6412 RepID=T1EQC5_HELRO|nr:hypothetical protein HELRODRAFT_160514 [Helobdella robusta]ESO06348.1 hypothetical protein HELRODRAFT_160514 [Helobdella robusta]
MAVKKLSELTVAELKHELKKRKLEVAGDKATLLARLKKSLVEDGKFKANATKNKTDDQRVVEKTPINTESTSQETKDVAKPDSSEQLAASSSKVETDISALKKTSPVKNDCKNENSCLSSMGTEQNNENLQDQSKMSLTKTTSSESQIDFDTKAITDNSTLLGSIDKSCDKQIKPCGSVKENVLQTVSEKIPENVKHVAAKELPKSQEENVMNAKNLVSAKKEETKIVKEETKIVKEETKNVSMTTEITPTVKRSVIPNSEAVLSNQSVGPSVKNDTTKKEDEKKISDLPKSLWITGLVGAVKASDLKQAFGKYGKVSSAKIVTSAKNPGSKCFGLIAMQTHEEAKACIVQFHNKVLLGSTVTVEFDVKRRIAKPIQEPQLNVVSKKLEAKDNVQNLVTKTPEKLQDSKVQETHASTTFKDNLTTSTPVPGVKHIELATVTPIAKSEAVKSTNVPAQASDKNTSQQSVIDNKPVTTKPENESTSVWLSGLPSKIKAADLKTLCLISGKVLAAKVVASSKSETYFGLVTMSTKDEAEGCVKKLDKHVYEGKPLSCEMAPYDNVTPELLKHFAKAKDQPSSNDNKKEENKKPNDETKKKDSNDNGSKVDKHSGNDSSFSKNKSSNSSRNMGNRNSGNYRRGGYNNYRGGSNRNIPSLMERSSFNRSNQFSRSSALSVDPIVRNYNVNMDRNRLEHEQMEAERAKMLLYQEQQRQQQMSAFRDGWSQAPSRMKRSYDSNDDFYWGPPPNQSSSKRFAPNSLYPSTSYDSRMGSGQIIFF